MVSDKYDGAPECNDECPHPLGFTYGMLSYLMIFIICSLRDRIMMSNSYAYIEAYYQEEHELAHERKKMFLDSVEKRKEEEWGSIYILLYRNKRKKKNTK